MGRNSDGTRRLATVWGRPWEIVADRGAGSYVWDEDGPRFLDFTSGIGVLNTGHSHPRVVEAIRYQANQMIHAQANIFFHRPMLDLAEELTHVLPAHLDRFFFSNSGAEGVEAALKLARHATGRPNVIAFEGGFHGRTVAAMSLTSAKAVYRAGYQPLMSGVFFAPFVMDPHGGEGDEESVARGLARLRTILQTQTSPAETAAMIIEPVLGEGGYRPAARSFLEGVRAICDEHGILLILDEIQSGSGRTGRFVACQLYGVKPDILVLAKGIASGLPLSVVAASHEIMDRWLPGVHGGTYGGNALACAAALATVRVIKEEDLATAASERGSMLKARLEELRQDYPELSEVRGIGCMVGTEFRDPDTDLPAANVVTRIQEECYRRDLLLLTCGPNGNVLRWIPPLIIGDNELNEALNAFTSALDAAKSSAVRV